MTQIRDLIRGSLGVQKFTTTIDDDSFRNRAEQRLFGSADTKVVLWADFKRAAVVNTNWPLHKISLVSEKTLYAESSSPE